MATTPVLPGANNAYVPSFESSGRLTVDFVRDPKKFPVNQYIRYIPTPRMKGVYLKFEVQDRLRITDTNLASSFWQDGADAPQAENGEKFSFPSYECKRYAEVDVAGNLLVQQADFGVMETFQNHLAQKSMTKLTQRVLTMLQTSGNWPTANTSAVSSISGVTGTWELSTTARSDIKRSLDYATEIIVQATGGVVQDDDLILVLPKKSARLLSISQEIRDYIKGGPDAKPWIIGKEADGWRNRAHGLPDMLYGHPVIVEDTVKVTSARGATDARAYVGTYTSPFMVARPGSLVGPQGDFSTAVVFGYNGGSEAGGQDNLTDMLVDIFDDQRNMRQEIRVITNTAEVLAAGGSGFLFTSAFA